MSKALPTLDTKATPDLIWRQVLDFIQANLTHQSELESIPESIYEILASGVGRCVEFSAVAKAIFKHNDVPARTIGLLTCDCETRLSGAGHVIAEAWLGDGWCAADPEWNVFFETETGEGIPTSQLVEASESENLHFIGKDNKLLDQSQAIEYWGFLEQYLRFIYSGGKALSLKGRSLPTLFQGKIPLNFELVSLSEFD